MRSFRVRPTAARQLIASTLARTLSSTHSLRATSRQGWNGRRLASRRGSGSRFALLRRRQDSLQIQTRLSLRTLRGEATRGQSLAHATTSLAPRSTGTLARERGAGTPRLLRRARQHPPSSGLPRPARAALVRGAPAPRPATPPQLAADAPPRGEMAPSRPHHASLARSAIRRPHPSQEPSALAAHAGICAGGRPQGRSLPR